MTDDSDVATFLHYSRLGMHIEALFANWEEDFVQAIAALHSEETRESFRRGFAKSIMGQVTPGEYEKATGWDFDTDEEFREHLKRIWMKFYGDDDPAKSLA